MEPDRSGICTTENVGGTKVRFPKDLLQSESAATGFRSDILEKVLQITHLLKQLIRHPFLKGRIVLKGGTALNLFLWDVPRLSVDIDLNYIGSLDRNTMLQERPKIEEALMAVCEREGITVSRQPDEHAGGKWRFKYVSAINETGNIEVDLNYILRKPLWPIQILDSKAVGSYSAKDIPVLDLHELAAGKLAALFSRRQSRDLFDGHHILNNCELDPEKLRLGFVIYGAMSRTDWRTISPDTIQIDPREVETLLFPALPVETIKSISDVTEWTERIIRECQDKLDIILPFTDSEVEFLNKINDEGNIEPELLASDEKIREIIRSHPGLLWKALNVQKHKGN